MKILIAWIVALLIVAEFLTLRVFVPGLLNLHNDGALILALILVGAAMTAPFLLFKFLLNWKP